MIELRRNRKKFFNLSVLFLIISIGIFLRIYNLGRQSIWLDEARAFSRANKSTYELWNNQIKESSPPLYDILLHYFLSSLNKKEEFQLRLLSVIFGILLIPFAFIVGRSIFNQRVGLFFSLLIAISPYHIYYSQDAKMYSLLAVLSLGSFFFYYLSLEKEKITYWISYASITVLLIYCHNYAFLLLAAQIFIYLFFYKKFRSLLPRFILTNLIMLLFSIPRITCLFQQSFMDFNPWINAPKIDDIIYTFKYFSLLCWHMKVTFPLKLALSIILPIYIVILTAAIFVKNNDKEPEAKKISDSQKLTILLFYLLITLIIALLVSLKKPIYIAGRYDMSVFPAFFLIIGFGLDKIKKSIRRNYFLGAILVAIFICLHNYYFIFRKSNDREVADYARTRINKNEIWIFTDLSLPTFRYYCEKEGFFPNVLSFPVSDPGWLPRGAIEAKREYVSDEINKLRNKMQPFLKKDNLLRVMYTDIKINQLLIEELKREHQFIDIIKFTPGRSDNQITAVYIFRIHSRE